MYLSIDLTRDPNAVSIISYISTFLGFLVHDRTLNLNFFTATSFKIRENQLKQHNTTRWYPPTFPNYSTNTNGMQSFDTWPAGSKQKPQDLSNAGFFYQGKVSKHKSLFITENISPKPKLIYKWFRCYRKYLKRALYYPANITFSFTILNRGDQRLFFNF